MTESRREATTEWIRGAARQEFAAVGARAFSLGGVAKRGHISKGAVYQRWPDKTQCIADLIDNDLPAAIQAVGDPWLDPSNDLRDLVLADLANESNLQELRFIAECVLAAHDDPTLTQSVLENLVVLSGMFAPRIPDNDHVPAMSWWMVSTWLANALLRTSGCPIPETFVTHTSDIVADVGNCARVVQQLTFAAGVIESISALTQVEDPGDDTSQALIFATQQLIEAKGISEADAREIARSAGMTTGALYRRFGGKSEVLSAAFRAGLTPDRYGWSDAFLACVERQDLPAAAEILATHMKKAWTDTNTARRLIDFTIAAHTDTAILSAIFAEMQRVGDHRTQLFSALIAAGVIRPDLSPEALTWLIQVPTVGTRLVASLGFAPTDEDLSNLMGAYLVFLALRSEDVP